MIGKADAVVIGGGIMGASTAHFLTKLGFGQVVLVEKRKICGGSTQYSAAHVRQHYSNEVGIRLAFRGASMFANAEEELGGPAGFHQIGYMLFAPPEGAQALREAVAVQQGFGVQTSLLAPDEVTRRWPQLQLDGVGARVPRANVRLCRSGAHGRVARPLRRAGRTARLRGLRGAGHPDRERARRRCRHGRWRDCDGRRRQCLRSLERPDRPHGRGRLPDHVQPGARGHLRSPTLENGQVPRLPRHLRRAARLYCRPYVGGKILVGDGWPKQKEPVDPETYDDGTDEAHVSKMVPRLVNRLPALAPVITQPNYGGTFVTGYSGVYDITEDWYPIVGEEEVGGYYSCFGGSGHGFKLGPAIGEALADAIAGRTPAIDISSLSGSRFSEGRTFGSVWGPGNRA